MSQTQVLDWNRRLPRRARARDLQAGNHVSACIRGHRLDGVATGIETRYAHLSRYATGVHDRMRVQAGQVIGHVGNSGLSTGPHLYFESWIPRRRVDPLTAHVNLPARLAVAVLESFNDVADQIDPWPPMIADAQ